MNGNMINETSKEQAWKIYFLPEESFELKLNKITEKNLLKELYLLAVQKDNNRKIRLISEQAKKNNISFN